MNKRVGWVKETNRQEIDIQVYEASINKKDIRPKYRQQTADSPRKRRWSKKDILQWRVWSWLRMNASYRLNTCKSRGNDKVSLLTLGVDRRTGE